MAVHPYLQSKFPLAMAHRGGALETAENTLEGFRYAASLGFRYIETDVQVSRDGVVVCFHDPVVDRVSQQTGAIDSWSWAELAELTILGGSQLIDLESLLEELPDTFFNIDAKSDAVVEPLLGVLTRRNAFARVCVGTFSDERGRRIRNAEPDVICTALGPRGSTRLLLSSWGLPIETPPGDVLQLPPKYRGFDILTERFISHAHDLGLAVHAWTINERREIERLLDLGIDGIMTDRPSLLKQVFADRGFDL